MGQTLSSKQACRTAALALATALPLTHGASAADEALALPSSVMSSASSPLAGIARWPTESRAASRLELSALSVRVIELPGSNGPGSVPGRRHHALSIRTETPQRMLRMMGVEASDCAAHMRMPSRIKQTRDGVEASIEAQLGFSCAF
jgi:hypothetical protein